jgi:DNA-binding LacI/PurR family transcriptional regulator
MLNLLAKGLPITAVVAYNDAMAAGAISVLATTASRCRKRCRWWLR